MGSLALHMTLILMVASGLEDKNFSKVAYQAILSGDGDQVLVPSTWKTKGLDNFANAFPESNQTVMMEWNIGDAVTPAIDEHMPSPVESFQATILLSFFVLIGISLEGHVKAWQCLPV